MNIAITKVELVKQLLNTNNPSFINHIKALFETQDIDLWDEMPIEIKKSVARALKQADEGEFKSHDEVMKKYTNYLPLAILEEIRKKNKT
jgi:predicted transcriptional regulator